MADLLMPDVLIDLTLLEVKDLADATATRQGRKDTPFGTYLFAGWDPGAELARHVERQVFGEVFGNSPSLLAAEYGPYEGASLFACVLDHRRRLPVGGIRLVLPDDADADERAHARVAADAATLGTAPPAPAAHGACGLKSLDDLARVWGRTPEDLGGEEGRALEPARAWDIATLAVAPEYRRGLVSLALYQACCTAARRSGAAWFVTILDVVVLRQLQARLGHPFAPVPRTSPLRYLDSPASVPCTSDLEDWERRLAERDPVLHETLFEGCGLEPAISHPDWAGVPHLVAQVRDRRRQGRLGAQRPGPLAVSTSGTRSGLTGGQ
ncbi:MAG: hypothetical protein GEV08_08200 [Acidimicrobiia bacterium]|nr:hypothetical protein [Acidimicrobiia bacterium]